MAVTAGTITVSANTSQLEKDIAQALSKQRQINLHLSGTGLSRATRELQQFDQSLEFAQKRVITFSTVAATIYATTSAFKSVADSVINVEKALTDINVIFNGTSTEVARLSNALFDISRKTGQSFYDTAEAAKEFSRQGLGLEETIKRTRDALILTRLSGLDVKDSIEAITASVNSFSKTLIDSSEVVNKLASVDAAFAVSSADLSEAVKRSASSAEEAGISYNQLLGIITAIQQTTARGGANIGNSIKTIFARISSTDTLEKLRDYGIELDKSQDALTKLQAISAGAKLNPAYASDIGKLVGGIYQINNLIALLKDLSNANSTVAQATKIASDATAEATQRNERLNTTLASLLNKTKTSFIQASSKVGSTVLSPVISDTLTSVNNVLESIGKKDETDKVGFSLGEGLLKGFANFFSGPGLAGIAAVTAKIFAGFAAYTYREFSNLAKIGGLLNTNVDQQLKISSLYNTQAGGIEKVNARESQRLQIATDTLGILNAQNATLNQLNQQATGQFGRGLQAQAQNRLNTMSNLQATGPTPLFQFPPKASAANLPLLPLFPQNTQVQVVQQARQRIYDSINPQLEKLFFLGVQQASRTLPNAQVGAFAARIYSDIIRQVLNAGGDINVVRALGRSYFDAGKVNAAQNRFSFANTGGIASSNPNERNPFAPTGFTYKNQIDPAFSRNIALGITTLLPIVAGIAQQYFNGESRADRISSAAIGGVSNTASIGGLGFLIGGAPGAIIGSLVGLIQSIPDIVGAIRGKTAPLQKEYDTLNTSLSKTQEALTNYIVATEQLEQIYSGEVTASVEQQAQLSDKAAKALSILNNSIGDIASKSGDINKLKDAVNQFGSITNRRLAVISPALDVQKQFEKTIFSPASWFSPTKLNTDQKGAVDSFAATIASSKGPGGKGLTDLFQSSDDVKKFFEFDTSNAIQEKLLLLLKEVGLDSSEMKDALDTIFRYTVTAQEFTNEFKRSIFSTKQAYEESAKNLIASKEKIKEDSSRIAQLINRISDNTPKIESLKERKNSILESKYKDLATTFSVREAQDQASFPSALVFSQSQELNLRRSLDFQKLDDTRKVEIQKALSDAQININNILVEQAKKVEKFGQGLLNKSRNAPQEIKDEIARKIEETQTEIADKIASLSINTLADIQDLIDEESEKLKNVNNLLNTSVLKNSERENLTEQAENLRTNIAAISKVLGETRSTNNDSIRNFGTNRTVAEFLYLGNLKNARIEEAINKSGGKPDSSVMFGTTEERVAYTRKIYEIEQKINAEKGDEIEKQRALNLALSEAVAIQNENALAAGRITGDQYRASQALKREREQDKNGGRLSGKSIGESFRDEFAYGTRDLYDDLEKGAKTTAQTIKSSFADAFKSMRDDGKSAGDAVIDALVSIGKKMGDIALDIALNSIFSSAFSGIGGGFGRAFGGSGVTVSKASSGGLIKGYSSGGVVTGGSGTKDDVPALLSDGEYVVKKSAVQRYGPDVLRKINSGEAVFDGQNTIMVSGGNRFDATFANTFTYNDRKKPTAGELVTDPNLSSFALEDPNNPQNALRQQREETLFSYLRDKAAYDLQKANTLKAWKKGERNKALGALIQAGVSLVGIGVGYAAQNGAFSSSRNLGTSSISYGGKVYTAPNTNQFIAPSDPGFYAGHAATGGLISHGAVIRGYASGGGVFGGNSASDRNMAMLTGGEFVATRAPVNYYGLDFFNKLNRGQVQVKRMADGGAVGGNITPPSSNTDLSQIAALAKSFQKDPAQPNQEPSRGVNIVNNFNITVERGTQNNNVSQLNTPTSNENNKGETANTQESDSEKVRKFTDKMANIARGVIIQELRPQGLLDFR